MQKQVFEDTFAPYWQRLTPIAEKFLKRFLVEVVRHCISFTENIEVQKSEMYFHMPVLRYLNEKVHFAAIVFVFDGNTLCWQH